MKILKFKLMAPEGDAAGGGGANGAGAAGDDKGAGAASGAAAAAAGAGATAADAGKGGQGAAAGGSAGAGGAAAGAGAAAAGDGQGGAAGGAGAAAGGDGKGGQAAGDGKGAADPNSAGAKWEANWRESYASGDEKKLNALKRYNSPKDALDALFEARNQLATTRPTSLSKDATPEQVAEYRKSNGIPEKAEGYFDLAKDVHLEEGDREILTPYAGLMHKHNISPEVAKEFIALRQAEANRQMDERQAADTQLRTRTEDELRQEWGPQYRATVNNIKGFLKHQFGEDAEAILQARTPDGDPLVGTPGVLRALAQLAAMVKGAPSSIVGADGGVLDGRGVDQRITEIEKLMGAAAGTPEYKQYWNSPAVQAEYRNLINARDEMKRRAA